MSCSGGTCAPACCIPRATGTTNMLGFSGAHGCCLAPCVQFPPYKVQICVLINSRTQVKISPGCAVAPVDGSSETDCPLYFPPAVAEDTYGRRCRMVSWSRQLPAGAFIRIQLCPLDGCTDACSTPGYTSAGAVVNNGLKVFNINGISKLETLLAVRDAGGDSETPCYLKAACIGARSAAESFVPSDTCCQWITDGTSSVSWLDLNNLPVGTEFVIGPIGTV